MRVPVYIVRDLMVIMEVVKKKERVMVEVDMKEEGIIVEVVKNERMMVWRSSRLRKGS